MNIEIQPASGTPLYLQIANQVRYLVSSEQLDPGEEIPPIRALAERLLINPNTVARAYLELEREGILIKKHGTGTYVAEDPPVLGKKRRQKVLADRVDMLLAEARQLGFDLPELLELVSSRAAKMNFVPSP